MPDANLLNHTAVVEDGRTSSSARARTERSLSAPAGLPVPLSEFLLPARLGSEPSLAVTGLVIVCIMVKIDGGMRSLGGASR